MIRRDGGTEKEGERRKEGPAGGRWHLTGLFFFF